MNVEPIPSSGKEHETSSYRPLPSLLAFLDQEIQDVEDFSADLKAVYPESAYETFEDKFTQLRKRFKDRSQLIANKDDYLFLNHTDNRRKAVEQILNSATAVATRFQEARENSRLERSRTKNDLEDLINAIKNLRELSKGVG